MPIHVSRKRGGVWYARGTVRVGKTAIVVPEFSTGSSGRGAAEDAAAAENARIIESITAGPAGRARDLTIADCIFEYAKRPGGVRPYDADRLKQLNVAMGGRPLSEAQQAWASWLRTRPRPPSPGTAARWRAVLQAAINHGAAAHDVPPPRIPGVKGGGGVERVIYLQDDERRRLLAAYSPNAACPILLLAYQGMRTQEVLRLDWRAVNFTRRSLYLAADQTKTQRGRTAPMHPRVDALLFGLWHAAGRPSSGPVFLSARGTPYADTRARDGGAGGGNPLKRAHATACRAAGVTGFRVHDWRHDWASRMVMAGVDLYTLMRLGGWQSLRMVQRYAAVSHEHLAEAIGRVR